MSKEAASNFMALKYSCNTIKSKKILTLDNYFELYTCPCAFFTSSISDFIDLYFQIKQGTLPFSGGYFEQPYKILEINAIIKEFVDKKEKEEMEKQQRNSKKTKR